MLVVGAGIVGAAVAWHLAHAGARVSVVEAGAPGGIATRSSWAWINASRGNPAPYFRLRVRAMAEWRDLARALPELRVAWVGGLLWDLPAEELAAFAAEHAAWGYPLGLVGRAEARRLEPELAAPPELAVHAPEEGAVEPLAAARALLAAAEDVGARVIAERPVQALDIAAGRVVGVETAAGRLAAEAVVLAAGIETAALAATAGFALPLEASPGLLVATKPRAPLLNGLVMAPAVHLRQTAEGRLLGGADFGGGDPGEDPAETAARVLAAMRGLLRAGQSLELEHHAVGVRPIPGDGFPAVGPVPGRPGLHLAVMHSGITLAPAVGRFLAEEILTGRRDPLLASYGPERFAQGRAVESPS